MGSSNYITNIAGEVSQHTEYFAFGETFVEEHKGSNNSPYKFNGKELDAESGLYYYGARYYDPRISIWASVDPLAEKMPSHSPYAYVANNPLRYIDPDGKFLFDVHRRILTNGISGINFNEDIIKGMGVGQSDPSGGIVHPDTEGTILNYWGGHYNSHDHFDSMNSVDIAKNFKSIETRTSILIKNYNAGKIKSEEFGFKIGEELHAIQDFYSHSNFVELYEQSGGDINGIIPTYQEVMKSSKYNKLKGMINSGNLITGEYDEDNHKTGPKSHLEMNKDQGNGSTYTSGTLSNTVPDAKGHNPTKYSKAAERAATRATKIYLQSLKNEIK